MEEFIRSEMLIGKEAVDKLGTSKVIVFGIGGVGGYVVEALARSGIGHIAVVDHDSVSISNLNRQMIATHSNLGRKKVDCIKDRILDINPECVVESRDIFYLKNEDSSIDFKDYDYIVDAIDTVSAKLDIIEIANSVGTPIISSMGTGNKLDPTMLEVTDISKTTVCPLARVMRRELKNRGIYKLKVVYSKEAPKKSDIKNELGKPIPASMIFVPASAGLIIANEVVKDIIGN